MTLQPGAILLVGGRSARMGQPKAGLDWHGEPLASRVTRVLARSVGDGPVVAVRAPGQELPQLPGRVEVVDDPGEGDGPLRGLATGLAALAGRAEIAFASSVDAPFLDARLVSAVLDALGPEDDAAVPVTPDRRYPLAAAYRVELKGLCDNLLSQGERRVNALADRVRTRLLVDLDVDALRNINTPDEYAAAFALPAPLVTIEASGSRIQARVFRLAEALTAVELSLDEYVAVVVNGVRIAPDPWYPLARGDHVVLIA